MFMIIEQNANGFYDCDYFDTLEEAKGRVLRGDYKTSSRIFITECVCECKPKIETTWNFDGNVSVNSVFGIVE